MNKYHFYHGIALMLIVGAIHFHLTKKEVEHAWAQTAPSFVRLTTIEQKQVVDWIYSLQYRTGTRSSGAIAVSDGPTYEAGTGRVLRRVTPYFAHLGVLGVLDSNDSRKISMAKNWIIWYLSHVDTYAGVPLDTWYSLDGVYETTCPVPGDIAQCTVVDAEDSSAALFFSVLNAYVTASGDTALLTKNKIVIGRVASTLVGLIDMKDGLSIAKKVYPMKYTLDNAEVYAGLYALESVNARLGYTLSPRGYYVSLAQKTRATLLASSSIGMTQASTSLFYWAKDGAGVRTVSLVDRWYPDAMAQYWPHLFKVTSEVSATSSYSKVIGSLVVKTGQAMEKGNCETLKQATGGAHEPSLVYAMYLKKDMRGALLTRCIFSSAYSSTTKSFTWPFHVGQAGWLLRK
jgi:hypothetical protein